MGTPVMPPQMVPMRRRRSVFGPIMLIGLGIIFLLINSGKLNGRDVGIFFVKYWPLFIIFWGVVKLYEHAQARREGVPAPGLGAGGVVLLVFVILFGSAASTAYRHTRNLNWNKVGEELDINDEDIAGFMGQRYDFNSSIDQAFPATAMLKVNSDRGAIKITPSTDGKLHVAVHKALHADSQGEANTLNGVTDPKVSTTDSIVTIDSARRNESSGSIDLEIQVPEKVALELTTTRGTVDVERRSGNVTINNNRGDVTLENITGDARATLHGGNLNARKISGDVSVEGRADDAKISDVSGALNLQGEFLGDLDFSNIAKGLRFKSSRTDMQTGKLTGRMTMASGDLHASEVAGPVRIVTRSKDIHLDDLTGDVRIDTSNGEVELHPKAPLGNVEITNRKGDIRVFLPGNGNFTVDATSVRGELSSDFTLNTSNEHNEVRATGTVNKGGSRIQLTDEHGNISIHKE